MSDERPSTQDAPDREPPAGRAREQAPRAARPGADREEIPYIDDPWTKVFVGVVILVFAAIFVYAIFLGRGGLLTTTPIPSAAPSASATASATPSATPASTATPFATASPSPSASLAPTASATPSAGASPSATP